MDSSVAVCGHEPMILPSRALAEQKRELEEFLHDRVYRHPTVSAMRAESQAALREMFDGYVARPELLSPKFQERVAAHGLHRTVGDYLAGMTDRYAQQEHVRLFGAAS